MVMKLAYTKNTTNINDTTIHSAFAIPINKNFNEFKALSDERYDILIKTYIQLQLLIIDDLKKIGNKMLSFLDCRLRVIKQVHDDFHGWFRCRYVM